MASSTPHAAQQHPRYPLAHQTSRDEALRLPSIKDLNFHHYSRRHPHDTSQMVSPDHQDNTARSVQSWARSNQPQSASPVAMHPNQQQHTPPLSAGHDTSPPKLENGGFLTPGMPLSAQSTPVPGSVTVGPGARTEDVPHPKRQRRITDNMGSSRDERSPHQATYPSPYGYSHPQPPPPPPQVPNPYHQMQSSIPHSGHPSHPAQPPLDHIHQVPISAHPGYTGYHYLPNRVHPHHSLQHPHGNPYPSPGPAPPAPPPQGPWEQQQHHSQPVHVQQPPHPPPPHQPPPHPPQHQPHPHPHAPPQHPHISQHSQHVPPHSQPPVPHHQPPPPMPPQHSMHPQQQQHSQHPSHPGMPPPPPHAIQHPHATPQPQAPPQYPQHPQHQQAPFVRTTPIVPTNIDTRTSYPMSDLTRVPSARDSTMAEIVRHCHALYAFASRYAQMQQTLPDICPSPEELSEMAQRAAEVVRLLEEYRRLNLPESEQAKLDSAAAITPPEDHRPPKRPWEDISQEDNAAENESASFPDYSAPGDKAQTTAEQDMEIIRTKRATSTAGGSGSAGQQKSKYRKRSRATPPGKCHSCNIRETPEWRRGPDGARTLCNACGLHYAKLQRKRDKMAGPNGEAPRIDLETLRASARAADMEKGQSRKVSRSQPSTEPTSPAPQQHHQGSFQLITMMPAPQESAPSASEPNRVSQQPHQSISQGNSTMIASIPPPPWSTSVQSSTPAARGYAPEQLQHQSFLRSSHPNATSPR